MKTNKQIATQVSLVTIIANTVLAILKLVAGILSMSSAMISDAADSMTDVLSTFMVMIGVRISNKTADENHPYGHERLECVVGVILALVIAATGIGIGYDAVQKIIEGAKGNLPSLNNFALMALITAAVSVISKEAMYRYTRAAAKKISSGAMMANAWNFRSDALASIGSIIGIGGAMLGVPLLDPIAGAVICLLVLKVAFGIARDAFGKMVDKSCDTKTVEKIRKSAESTDGVYSVDKLKTRLFGDKVYAEIEIACNPQLTLADAHDIAEAVHRKIETEFPEVKHCVVHINPIDETPQNTPSEN